MGKIAGVLTAMFAFFVAAPLQLTAQAVARDSGDYNNSTMIKVKRFFSPPLIFEAF